MACHMYRFLNKISGIFADKPVEYRYRYDISLSFTGNLQVSADISVSVYTLMFTKKLKKELC